MRRWVLATGATALIALPTVLAFFSGGFFDKPRIIGALAAWVLVALVAVTAPRPLPVSTSGRLALAGLALLCAWTALSIAWAPIGGRAQDDLQRLLLYLGAFIAGIALLREAGARRALEPALALGAFVVIAYGLAERLLPTVIDLAQSGSSAGRIEQPLTYWNAYGILATLGFVLAVRVAGDPARSRTLRAVLAAAGVVLGLGVYLSFARGALAAVALGLLVLAALGPESRPQLRSVITIVLAAAAASLLASGLTTVTSLEERDASQGLVMFAVLALAAAAAAFVAPRPPRRPQPVPALPVSRRATVVGVGVLALVGAGLLLAAFEGKPEGASPAAGADPARLGSIDTNRYRYWEVAARSFADHPIAGLGSGGFETEWLRNEDRVDASGDAHSLYLESAAELGVVGLAFLLLFLGGVGAALVRLYGRNPAAATGVAAGLAAWAFHAGLDWDWEMPAVTLPPLLLAAAAIAWAEEDAAEPVSVSAGRDKWEAAVPHLLGIARCESP
jgi:O-Antigen ligase